MIEYEKKIMLTNEEYLLLLKKLCKNKSVNTHINYYFDTDNFDMNKKGITYRIRKKNGKYKATIKNHNISYFDCSTEVDFAEKTEFDPYYFKEYGIRYQGCLLTTRSTIYKDNFCEVVIDYNTYLGNVDFELEIEYDMGADNVENILESIAEFLVEAKLIKNTGEFLKRGGKGNFKSQRFFKRKQEQRIQGNHDARQF